MKPKLLLCAFLLTLCSINSGQVPDSLKFISLRPADFREAYQQDNKAILIDVREFFEFRKSRLYNSVNIPSSGNIDYSADTINKESSLFLYCTTGYRSKRVAREFYEKGFLKLYSLDGGIVAWKKEGMPVDKKRIKKRK